MDWDRLSRSVSEHWLTLSPPSLLAVLGWLGRRRGWAPLAWLRRRWRVERALMEAQDALRASRQANESLMEMIEMLSDAGERVAKAREEGRLIPASEMSSPAPAPSPTNSSRSRRRRDRPAIR